MPLLPKVGCDPSPQSIVMETIVPLGSLQLAVTEIMNRVDVLCTAGAQVGPPRVIPVPLKLAACGLPGPLSVTVNVPILVPVVVGVKTTLMVQLPFAGSDAPQLSVCE